MPVTETLSSHAWPNALPDTNLLTKGNTSEFTYTSTQNSGVSYWIYIHKEDCNYLCTVSLMYVTVKDDFLKGK